MSHDGCAHAPVPEPAASSEAEELLDEARAGAPVTRRSMVLGLGALAAGAGIGLGAGSGTRATAAARPTPERGHGTELVLLGTRAGPPVVPSQTGIASALVVNGSTYVIDAGRSAVTQFSHAGLRFDSLRALFLTHLHADHLADYYNFFMLGGHIPNPLGDHIGRPVPVFGPGPAGGLQPKYGGGQAPTIAPDDPTPGTAATTDLLHRAYAYSSNVFLRDMDIADIRTLMDVHEIALPDVGATYENTAPSMPPFRIYRDENVDVSAVLVPHGPVFPAFAFRFDTAHGSVTFSGDTRKSENLVRLAHRTDILVHEAIGISGATLPPAALDHMLASHVLIDDVGGIAAEADARRLVVSHYADLKNEPIDRRAWRRAAQQGYHGPVDIGEDLQSFRLRERATRDR